MSTYNVETVNGNRTVAAERARKDDQGDLVFFNGSTGSPPVQTFFRANVISVTERGRSS